MPVEMSNEYRKYRERMVDRGIDMDKIADDTVHQIWGKFAKHFMHTKEPRIQYEVQYVLKMADRQAFNEMAQPLLRQLISKGYQAGVEDTKAPESTGAERVVVYNIECPSRLITWGYQRYDVYECIRRRGKDDYTFNEIERNWVARFRVWTDAHNFKIKCEQEFAS